MKLLGLDPSSTVTGYAVMEESESLIDAGRLLPRNKRSPAIVRIPEMIDEIFSLLDEHTPDKVIIEVTSGKVNTKRHGGSGAGLSTYGMAVGAVWQAVRSVMGDDSVVTVSENIWTRGVSKKARQCYLARVFPNYERHMSKDVGMDVADAIGLLVWWFQEQSVSPQDDRNEQGDVEPWRLK